MIPEDSNLLPDLNKDELVKKPVKAHKRGFSAGPRRVSKAKGKISSPDSSIPNGLR
jgi:hypothetical protein